MNQFEDLNFILLLPDTLIGTVITQVTGNDVDSGPALSYTLHLDTDSQGKFGIHRYGGGVSLTGQLDYEERTWYTVTVRTSDSLHQSEANLTILVEDVNDNAPVFTQDLYQVQSIEEFSEPKLKSVGKCIFDCFVLNVLSYSGVMFSNNSIFSFSIIMLNL